MGRVNRDALAADQAGGTSDERVPAPPLLYSPVNSNKWYSHRVGPSGSSRPNTSSWPPAYGSATYGCAACCSWVPTSFSLFYDPLGIPVGDGVPQGVEGFDGCEQQYDDATYLFENGWSTANPSIATVDTHGMHTGMGVGSTTTLVTSEPIEVQIPHNTHCFLEQRSVQGNDNVMAYAQISSTTVAPSTIGPHDSATVTVQVFHQDTTGISSPQVTVLIGTYSADPSGLTVTYSPTSRVVSLSGQQGKVTATFTVSSPSDMGTVVIQATLSSASPAGQITIKDPNPATNARATLSTTN